MKLGYADPPYIGCAHLYPEKTEVDHAELIARLERDYDGWVLHAAATPRSMAVIAPLVEHLPVRWCSWRKGFAAFKKNVPVGYAWEPVIVRAARKPVVNGRQKPMRDWINTDIQESITLKRGLTGAKPERVCHWAFELMAARPEDELMDLYPGTGAVTRAWKSWQAKFVLPQAAE